MEISTLDKSKHSKIDRNLFPKIKSNQQFLVNFNLFKNLQVSEIFQLTCMNPRTYFGNFSADSLQEITLNSNGFHVVLPKTQLICEKLPSITQTSDIHDETDNFMDYDDYFTETSDECDVVYGEPSKTFKDAIVQTAVSVPVSNSQGECGLELLKDLKCATIENSKQQGDENSSRSFILKDKPHCTYDTAIAHPSHGKIDFGSNYSCKTKLKPMSRIRIGLSKRCKPRPLHNFSS